MFPPLFLLLIICLSFWVSVSLCGWGATLSDSNCTDVNDILLMLSATSDTGAYRGHFAALGARLQTNYVPEPPGTEAGSESRRGRMSREVAGGDDYKAKGKNVLHL